MRFTTDAAREAQLLQWIADHGPGLVVLDPFYADVEERIPTAVGDVNGLKARGLINGCIAGGGHASASLTDAGRSYLEDVQLKRSSITPRRQACRMAILQWLDSVGAVSGSRGADWAAFYRDSRNDFCGQPFTEDDIETAAAWLWDNSFIDGMKVGEWDGPLVPYLTSRGVDCIETSDGDTRRYAETRNTPGRNVFSSHNMQVALGDNSTQTMNVGTAHEQVQNLLRGLLEVATTFASDDEQVGLAELAREAEADLHAEQPTSARARQFGERIRSLARASGQAGLAAVVDASVRELLALLPHLLH